MSSMDQATSPPAADARPVRTGSVVSTLLPDGGCVLFDDAASEVTVLSPTAGIVWEMCDGTRRLDDLIVSVQELYATQEPAVIARDVPRMVCELMALDLVSLE